MRPATVGTVTVTGAGGPLFEAAQSGQAVVLDGAGQ